MENDELELGHYGRIFRRSWWMFLLAVPAFVVLALFFLPQPQSFFVSEVSVLLSPGDADLGRPADPVNEATEVGIATSPVVGSSVIAASEFPLDLESWSENLLVTACFDTDALGGATNCDSQILSFSYRADTRPKATGLVQLTAETYLAQRLERETAVRESKVAGLRSRIDDVDLRLANESAIYAAAEPDSVDAERSLTRLRGHESERSDLLRQLEDVQGDPIDVGRLLGDASAPIDEATGIPRPIGAAVGVLMGLLIAAFAAILSDRLDRRVSGPQDIEADLGVPVLGNIPRITEDSPALVTAVGSDTPGADAFRRLAAAALVPRNGYVVDSIAVTGANDKEGRTTTAVNMALAFAQSGRKVVLIAADRRNDSIDRMFGLLNQPGLNDFLRSSADMDVARSMLGQAKETLGIRVVATGTGSAPPLSNSGLATILAAAHERGFIVVFDAPPALSYADGLHLASIVDAVYVVVAAGKTRRSELNNLRIQLLNVQADLAGAVLNQTSRLSLLPAGAGDIGSTHVPSGIPGNGRAKGKPAPLDSLPIGSAPTTLRDVTGRSATKPPQASPAVSSRRESDVADETEITDRARDNASDRESAARDAG